MKLKIIIIIIIKVCKIYVVKFVISLLLLTFRIWKLNSNNARNISIDWVFQFAKKGVRLKLS